MKKFVKTINENRKKETNTKPSSIIFEDNQVRPNKSIKSYERSCVYEDRKQNVLLHLSLEASLVAVWVATEVFALAIMQECDFAARCAGCLKKR